MREPEELISAYVDDKLEEGQFGELVAWINADEAHLRQFVKECLIHSRIRDILHEREVTSLFAEDPDEFVRINPSHILSLLEEEAEAEQRRAREATELAEREALAEAWRRELQRSATTLPAKSSKSARRWYGAIAAFAVAASLFLAVLSHLSPPPLPSGPEIAAAESSLVGIVTGALGATWGESAARVTDGEKVSAGPYLLTSGVIEITFQSGARVLVEAPASLTCLSADRVYLTSGRIVANVPPEAVGFTIRSKLASFVDLGTEFGVEVTDRGASVHVLEGEVSVVGGELASTGPSRILHAGVASFVSADGAAVEDIPFEGSRFLRTVPRSLYELAVLRSQPLLYWPMQEAASAGAIESRVSAAGRGTPAEGVQLASEGFHSQGRAANFVGQHGGVALGDLDELRLTSNFTCEAWARPAAVERGDRGIGPQRILSTLNSERRAGFAFGLVEGTWYDRPQIDLRLQFTANGAYECLSTADTQEDEWVHVAVVVRGDHEPVLYLNGVPSASVCKQSSGPDQDRWIAVADWSALAVNPAGDFAVIGRNPPGHEGKLGAEAFQGRISDVAVYDRALTNDEIAKHYQAGANR